MRPDGHGAAVRTEAGLGVVDHVEVVGDAVGWQLERLQVTSNRADSRL
jgi:hypothetical protein